MITFSGLEWEVKERMDKSAGPGPNFFAPDNVWVDGDGALHLRISQHRGQWYCAEVQTTQALGFGTYTWRLLGHVDQLEPQAVAGLFLYPTPDVGPDGSNEIGIELARFPHLASKWPDHNIVYSVWPAQLDCPRFDNERAWNFQLAGRYTTHQFNWNWDRIDFKSWHGHAPNESLVFARYHHAAPDGRACTPHHPMPLHINLWLLQGRPPQRDEEVELVVRDFVYEPWIPPSLDAVEKAHIGAVLQHAGWKIEGADGAARQLGLSPTALRRRIQAFGLKRPAGDTAQ